MALAVLALLACGHARPSPATSTSATTSAVEDAGSNDGVAPKILALNGADLALEAARWDPRDELPVVVFGWEAPCRVPARQEVIKGGKRLVLTFDVVVEESGDGLLMGLDRMNFVSFEGKEASHAMLAGQLQPLLALMLTSPTVVLSHRGEYLETEGVESALELALPLAPASDAATMRSPPLVAMIKKNSKRLWDSWVGAWLDWHIPAGKPTVLFESPESMSGVIVPQTSTHETLGRVRGAPSLLLLRTRVLVDGPEAVQASRENMRRMIEQGTPGMSPATITRFRQEESFTVAIDPETARPYRARSEDVVRFNGSRAVEIRDTAFDWSKAVGCTVP